MKKKIRIGILSHNYPTYSQERKDAGIFIYDFAQELSKYADVFVFCPDFEGKKQSYKKVPVTWFHWGGGKEKFGDWKVLDPFSIWKFTRLILIGARECIKFVKKNKIDFILASWLVPAGIYAWEVKRKLNIPYASWSLGSDINKYAKYPVLGFLLKKILRESDVRFANSYALIDKVKNISQKNCQFLPAITSIEQVIKRSQKKGFNHQKKFSFLFVGRLERVKGPDILLEAARILKDSSNDFSIQILGDGSLMQELKDYVKSQNLSEEVNFHGWAEEDTVASYMKASDCLVLPSRSESLPLVILEAAKFYLPVIATDVGDCKRLISDYNIGMCVARENPGDLALAMTRMIKKDRNKFSGGDFSKINKDFAQSNAVKIFLESIKAI